MRSLQRIRLTKWIPVVFVILGPLATCKATIIAEYNFLNDGNHIHYLAPASPNYDLDAQPNGTGFASANLYGTTPIGTRLGQAGLMTEPTEPTSQDNNYGFWAPKTLISSLPNWTVLLWFNRQDFANDDMLFYVGAGDGFSGTGAETYVFGTAAGSLAAQNYRDNSTIDWNANGGSIAPLGWHQAGIVRNGSSMSLYLDGSLLNTTPNVTLNSFNLTSNSVIVFGAAKWMAQAYQRTRVLDGLIDQIEVYDQALTTTEIGSRYQAFAVPEPSTAMMIITGLACVLLFRRRLLSP